MSTETEPTWSKPCARCHATVQRFRGEGDVQCARCGAWYNTFGQPLRDDWTDNPAWRDDDLDDLTGFEIQQLRGEH